MDPEIRLSPLKSTIYNQNAWPKPPGFCPYAFF
jgi:hypothetical protein